MVDREVEGLYIREAATLIGATATALRMWERHNLVSPSRTESGYRVYNLSDLERLRHIKQLVQDGVNPSGVRHLLDKQQSNQQNRAGRRQLGHTLRAFRTDRRMTLRELSEASGVSSSYISALERSLATPSLATLQKFATVFGTTVLELFSEAYEPQPGPVTLSHQRRVLASHKGVVIEDLSTAGSNLEPLLFTIEPGAGSEGVFSHAGDEFIYVLKGTFLLELDGAEAYSLAAGDAIGFASNRPHQFKNLGDEPTVVVWINTPRTF